MAAAERFTEAMTEQPPPPCEVNCQMAHHCASREVACQRFLRYVTLTVPRSLPLKFRNWQNSVYYPPGNSDYVPSRKIYDMVFNPDGPSLGRRKRS